MEKFLFSIFHKTIRLELPKSFQSNFPTMLKAHPTIKKCGMGFDAVLIILAIQVD